MSESDPKLLDARVQLLPLRSEAMLKELVARAAADQHQVLAATHVMCKGGQPVGYLSLGGKTTVQAWFDSRALTAPESLRMIEQAEAIMRQNGVGDYVVCVAETSPFAPHMERMGYRAVSKTVLWHRKL